MTSAEKLDRMAYRLLGEPSLFSRFVVGRPLRPYQLEPARAILRSVLERRGDQVSVILPRQGGRSELSAHLEAYLLNLHAAGGGTIVKAVGPDAARLEASRLRLEWALDNPLNHGRWRREVGGVVRLGKARCQLRGADAAPGPLGAGASVLLEVDQAQDLEADRAVASGAGLTEAYYGTPWRGDDLLRRVRAANLERERQDGVRRHFEYPWWVVAEWSREYGRQAEAERARLGDDHPLFRSQYRLEPLDGEVAFLSPGQRRTMRGDHARQQRRLGGATYVAGVGLSAGLGPTITVARVTPVTVAESVVEPRLEVVAQCRPGRPVAAAQPLAALREAWAVAWLVVGSSDLAASPAEAAGEVVALPLTAESRSRLALGFLAAVNGGRFKMYRHEEGADPVAAEFWRAAERCRCAPRPGRQLAFWVRPGEGRDDLVVSAALCAQAGRDLLARPGDRHDRR
jgi:hypothetical protein